MATKRLVAALAVACALSPAVYAASLKLYPVRIVLSTDKPVQTMTIHNDSADSSRVQLRAFAWHQVNGEDVFEQTRDVLANPAIFEVPAGGDQIARFGLRTAPGKVEKSYRVFLQEVPTNRPRTPGEIQTLLRISVPIFVPPANPVGRLEWRLWQTDAGHATLDIRNTGTMHVQISHVTLSGSGTAIADKDMSIYVLPGASKRLTLDTDAQLAAGQTVALSARTDQSDISASIVTEAPPHETGDR